MITYYRVMNMYLTFGEKLRQLREDADLSQSELGEIINVSQRKISYIECGECEPSLDDIRSICAYFSISSDYMLGLPKDLPYPKR